MSNAHVKKAENILGLGKRVLFVEGPDDEAIYTKWLEKIDPLFTGRLELVPCEGQQQLIRSLELLGDPVDAFALQDRDEWDAVKIAAVQGQHPRLLVNGFRHTLESYFCDPVEIVAALIVHDVARYQPLAQAFSANLMASLPPWVDHWALWSSLMRVQNKMHDEKLPCFVNQVVPIPTDPDIRAK
jgi:hypothetical protein